MALKLVVTCNGAEVDWKELAQVYEKAPFAKRRPSDLKRAFEMSDYKCFAFDKSTGQLIGAVRATSDGVYYATVYDVVVHPDFQCQGVGTALMQAIIKKLARFEKIFLTAALGREKFYKKFGFLHHNTAMGLYRDANLYIENGILSE